MSARGRQAVLLAILALVLVAGAAQPGPLFGDGARPEPFPPDVSVAPARTVDGVYDDRPEVRVLQLLTSMNRMWAGAFGDAGDRYRIPHVETRAGARGSDCGAGREGEWAGVYCARDRQIVIDMGDDVVRRAVLGADGADDQLGYILAHEVGHHVQALRGYRSIAEPARILRAELHAQCLAGVWGRAAGRALPPPWAYGEDAEHGTAAEQHRWLQVGWAHGRPADCDAVWD